MTKRSTSSPPNTRRGLAHIPLRSDDIVKCKTCGLTKKASVIFGHLIPCEKWKLEEKKVKRRLEVAKYQASPRVKHCRLVTWQKKRFMMKAIEKFCRRPQASNRWFRGLSVINPFWIDPKELKRDEIPQEFM